MSVGVIGLGYVGLPLVVAFAEAGVDVVAVDLDPRKVAALSAGDSYIEDVPVGAVEGGIGGSTRRRTISRWRRTDAVLICVPTPLTANREPDLSAAGVRCRRARSGAAARAAGGARIDDLSGDDS